MELTDSAKLRRAILCSLVLSALIVGFVSYMQINSRGGLVVKTPRFWIEKGLILVGFAAVILWNFLRDGPYSRSTRGKTS